MVQLNFQYQGCCMCCGTSDFTHERFRGPIAWREAYFKKGSSSLTFLKYPNGDK